MKSWIARMKLVTCMTFFAVKTCSRASGAIVGHLPMEVARPTYFLLLRGARIEATLTSTHYRRSPLMQGGLEIPCLVSVYMMLTLTNKKIIDVYKDLIDAHYTAPDETAVVGSFIHHSITLPLPKKPENRKRKHKETESSTSKSSEGVIKIKDIRSFFSNGSQVAKPKKRKVTRKEAEIISID